MKKVLRPSTLKVRFVSESEHKNLNIIVVALQVGYKITKMSIPTRPNLSTAGTLDQAIGQTPLIELSSLSKLTGCRIFGKAEFLNPGGSVKDRTALGIIQEAEDSDALRPGMRLYEGTAGNTGIGLATFAASKGYPCTIVMPNNQSIEKYQALEALGVELIKVAPVPFANPKHFYHTAKALSEKDPKGYWANQFENLANFNAHYKTTGPEVWQQSQSKIDIFATASGTGGTIAGVSTFLKEVSPKTQVVLVDPIGSGLYSWFHHNEIKAEGSSITEGIGIMRITKNMEKAKLDDAIQVNDQQMISMLYHLAQHEGLLVGPSSALNVYGAYTLARKNQNSGKTLVTILCDSALRYQSRIFNSQWLREKQLIVGPLKEGK